MIGRLTKLATGAALATAAVLGGAQAAHAYTYTYCCDTTATYTPTPVPTPGLVFSSTRSGQKAIWSANADGSSAAPLTTQYSADPSLDGARTHVAYEAYKPNGTIGVWLMNADGSNQHLLTSSPMHDYAPSLNAAGTRIVYTNNTSNTASGPQLFVMNTDGTGITQLTSAYDGSASSYPAWSPDGQHIAYQHLSGTAIDIWVMNADGTGARRVSYNGGEDPAWSPDGQRIAYWSNQTGQLQIFSTSAFTTQTPVRVTSRVAADVDPAWSIDGASIMFSEGAYGSSVLLSVNLSTGAVTTVANSGGFDGEANLGYPAQQKTTTYRAPTYSKYAA